jgi:hypothetical protein
MAPNARASEVYSRYIIVDMDATAGPGTKAEDAARWAAGELRAIYG